MSLKDLEEYICKCDEKGIKPTLVGAGLYKQHKKNINK